MFSNAYKAVFAKSVYGQSNKLLTEVTMQTVVELGVCDLFVFFFKQ